jgi:hypothetical protein
MERARPRPQPPQEEEEIRFFRKNAAGGAYALGLPYAWEMRQRILHEFDSQDAAAFANETARFRDVAAKWSVSSSTVRNYVKNRNDVLAEFDCGWVVAAAHKSSGAAAQIQARACARCRVRACGVRSARSAAPLSCRSSMRPLPSPLRGAHTAARARPADASVGHA